MFERETNRCADDREPFGLRDPFPYGRHIKGRSPGESNRCFPHADGIQPSLPSILSSPRCFSLQSSLHPTLPRANSTLIALQRARARDVELKLYHLLFPPLHDSPPRLRSRLCSVDFLPKYYKGQSKDGHVGTKEESENIDFMFF